MRSLVHQQEKAVGTRRLRAYGSLTPFPALRQRDLPTLLLQAWQHTRSSSADQPDAARFASKIIELHKSSGGTKTEAIRQMFEKRGL